MTVTWKMALVHLSCVYRNLHIFMRNNYESDYSERRVLSVSCGRPTLSLRYERCLPSLKLRYERCLLSLSLRYERCLPSLSLRVWRILDLSTCIVFTFSGLYNNRVCENQMPGGPPGEGQERCPVHPLPIGRGNLPHGERTPCNHAPPSISHGICTPVLFCVVVTGSLYIP